VERPFRRCLELAWQSAAEGNIGVGAVITDASNQVVAEGRNRVVTPPSGAEPVEFSSLAHAEINALIRLGRHDAGHSGSTIWTSLEPCAQCAAALLLARITDVRFLASDPFWEGAHRIVDVLPAHHETRRPVVTGPAIGPEAALACLLPLHFAAFWYPDSTQWTYWSANHPKWAALTDRLVKELTLARLAEQGATVDDVLEALREDLGDVSIVGFEV
jgi:tRNA(adenine34) deaminase